MILFVNVHTGNDQHKLRIPVIRLNVMGFQAGFSSLQSLWMRFRVSHKYYLAFRYSVARFNDQKLSETSSVASFKRPEQLLELYEFEGCPFCKKVGDCDNNDRSTSVSVHHLK